jgi:hypothetical protein
VTADKTAAQAVYEHLVEAHRVEESRLNKSGVVALQDQTVVLDGFGDADLLLRRAQHRAPHLSAMIASVVREDQTEWQQCRKDRVELGPMPRLLDKNDDCGGRPGWFRVHANRHLFVPFFVLPALGAPLFERVGETGGKVVFKPNEMTSVVVQMHNDTATWYEDGCTLRLGTVLLALGATDSDVTLSMRSDSFKTRSCAFWADVGVACQQQAARLIRQSGLDPLRGVDHLVDKRATAIALTATLLSGLTTRSDCKADTRLQRVRTPGDVLLALARESARAFVKRAQPTELMTLDLDETKWLWCFIIVDKSLKGLGLIF